MVVTPGAMTAVPPRNGKMVTSREEQMADRSHVGEKKCLNNDQKHVAGRRSGERAIWGQATKIRNIRQVGLQQVLIRLRTRHSSETNPSSEQQIDTEEGHGDALSTLVSTELAEQLRGNGKKAMTRSSSRFSLIEQ